MLPCVNVALNKNTYLVDPSRDANSREASHTKLSSLVRKQKQGVGESVLKTTKITLTFGP